MRAQMPDRFAYLTGEMPQIGDRVRHYVDGDEGEVLSTDFAVCTVGWRSAGDEQGHYADELLLICR